MSFTNPAPNGGAYVTGDIIDESEINYWCSILPDCVDGAGGGAYTLSAPLIFSGDVVEVEELEVTADCTLGSSVSDSLTIYSFSQFVNDLIIGSSSADALTVNAASTFNSDLSILGNTSIGNSSGDSLTVTATAAFNNGVTLGSSDADAVTLNGVMSSGTGRIIATYLDLPDATGSHSVAAARYVFASPTAPRTYTLSFASPVDGDWVRIFNRGPSDTITLAGLISTTLAPGGGLMLMRVSGSWIPIESWTNT